MHIVIFASVFTYLIINAGILVTKSGTLCTYDCTVLAFQIGELLPTVYQSSEKNAAADSIFLLYDLFDLTLVHFDDALACSQ